MINLLKLTYVLFLLSFMLFAYDIYDKLVIKLVSANYKPNSIIGNHNVAFKNDIANPSHLSNEFKISDKGKGHNKGIINY